MTINAITDLHTQGQAAKAAARKLAYISTEVKNAALRRVADELLAREEEVLANNADDYREAQEGGMSAAMLDRLELTPSRLAAMANDVLAVAALPDPVGETFDMRTLPNGLQVGSGRVRSKA